MGEDGLPRAVRRAGWAGPRAVARVADTWEFEDAWWRERPARRRYPLLVLADGTPETVFRDLVDGAWYAQRDADD